MRAEDGAAFLGNRLFDIRHDLSLVWIVLQPPGGSVEVEAQGVVSALLQLECVPVQIDGDDSVHGSGC